MWQFANLHTTRTRTALHGRQPPFELAPTELEWPRTGHSVWVALLMEVAQHGLPVSGDIPQTSRGRAMPMPAMTAQFVLRPSFFRVAAWSEVYFTLVTRVSPRGFDVELRPRANSHSGTALHTRNHIRPECVCLRAQRHQRRWLGEY